MGSTRTFPLAIVSLIPMFGSARIAVCQRAASRNPIASPPDVAVGAQYDATHVYVAAEDFDHFVGSVVATFGGTTSRQVVTVTPTPSSTLAQAILTPVGTFSVVIFH